MAILLALASALAYGLSDFVGGLVGRRAPTWSVAVLVQTATAVSTTALALVTGGSPAGSDLAWAALGGVGSGVGVGFLFRGLAGGRMSVVAPLSAVGAAILPVLAGIGVGERPGLLVTAGIVVALPGIWLVAGGEDQAAGPAASGGVVDGVLAGLGFGVMFTVLGQVPTSAGLWPLAVAQAASVVAAASLAIALRQPWRPVRSTWLAVPAGPLSAVALICFQLAAQGGLLSVSSVLASFYPAVTIVLAVLLLNERVHRGQGAGLALCATTVGLVALG